MYSFATFLSVRFPLQLSAHSIAQKPKVANVVGLLGALPRLSFPLCFLAVETSLLVHWCNVHNVHAVACMFLFFSVGRLVVFTVLRSALCIYGRIACVKRPHYASGFLSPGFGFPCTLASSTLLALFQRPCTIFFSTPPPKLSFCGLLFLFSLRRAGTHLASC